MSFPVPDELDAVLRSLHYTRSSKEPVGAARYVKVQYLNEDLDDDPELTVLVDRDGLEVRATHKLFKHLRKGSYRTAFTSKGSIYTDVAGHDPFPALQRLERFEELVATWFRETPLEQFTKSST